MAMLFMYDNLSIKKILVNFELIFINSQFGTNPMVSPQVLSTLPNVSPGGKLSKF